jgi:hypothetical protein
MRRFFIVPVLTKIYNNTYTQEISSLEEYSDNLKGKYEVSTRSIGSESNPIETIEKAEREVERRINKQLNDQIDYMESCLLPLKEAKLLLKEKGIKAFEDTNFIP